MWESIKYFNSAEFDSPDMPGSGEAMNPKFIKLLEYARRTAGIPFHINSGYRTGEHNEKVGGIIGSAHTKGLAADIQAKTSFDRYVILKSLMSVGFNRIGIYSTFIHVDMDSEKEQNLVWYG